MAAILFGMFKHVHCAPEDDFYEAMDQKHFFVHKMNEENEHFGALVSLKNILDILLFMLPSFGV